MLSEYPAIAHVPEKDSLESRLLVVEANVASMMSAEKVLETKLDINTAATQQILDVVTTFKGGMQLLGWAGVCVKWILSVGAAIAAIYGAFHLLPPGRP